MFTDKIRRPHPGLMREWNWRHNWRHTRGIGLRHLQERANKTALGSVGKINNDRHSKNCHKKRKYFLRLFFLLMACLESMPWLWFWIWVDSCQQKWNKPFFTCVDGLAIGSKLRLWDCTHVWSGELVSTPPYGTGNMNGNRFWVWDWRNK